MPGEISRPGMTDVDVCYGAYKSGSEGVQTAMQRARWKYDQRPLQPSGTLGANRFSDPISPVSPVNSTDEAQANDASEPSPPVHEGFENIITPPAEEVSPDQVESGLPPTPLTLNNSDDAEQQRDIDLSPPAIFTDGVRNALSSKQSGFNTPPAQQQASPLTPEPSPPRNQKPSPALPAMEQIEKPQFLHPIMANGHGDHQLRQYPSSHAESFATAREDRTLSPEGSIPQVHLPEADTLPQHWLDSTRELQSANLDWNGITVKKTPKDEEKAVESVTPTNGPHKETYDTSWWTSSSQPPSFTEPHKQPPPETSGTNQAKGLALSGLDRLGSDEQRSASYNNQVYRAIQEDNVKRHSSTTSAKSGAITVGIIVPSRDITPRTLKRQTKCYSLRDGSTDSKRNSGASSGDDPLVKSKKLRRPDFKGTLEDSPTFRASIRNVSSPAKLGPDASDMTALTYASLQDSPSAAKRLSKFRTEPQHKLRHFSHEDNLSRNMSIRRTSLEASPPLMSSTILPTKRIADPATRQVSDGDSRVMNNMAVKRSNVTKQKPAQRTVSNPVTGAAVLPEGSSPGSKLRRSSLRLENDDSVRRTSLDHASESLSQASPTLVWPSLDNKRMPSSPRKSLDARYLNPITTPMSVSQFSDRTDNIEIGEANGIRLYPHNNESLLVVENGSRPVSKGKDEEDAQDSRMVTDSNKYMGRPVFAAQVEPPTPILASNRPAHQVDSPLTNPRTAPEPPMFRVIPPTPEKELLEAAEGGGPQAGNIRADMTPQKRLSMLQRARRYSDIVFPGLASLRTSRVEPEHEPRDTHLSPLWKPEYFWDDFDSDKEYNDFEPPGRLPRGGDTSDVRPAVQPKSGLFPRALSKRLPGFRGTGGFLVGNSLGIDRHGTNNRRHYVSTGTRTLSQRQSQELIKNMSANPQRYSQESLRQVGRARTFVLPFTSGSRAQWVGARRFRAKMRAIRLAKEERAKEKRRAKIRDSIGYRVYHSGGGVADMAYYGVA